MSDTTTDPVNYDAALIAQINRQEAHVHAIAAYVDGWFCANNVHAPVCERLADIVARYEKEVAPTPKAGQASESEPTSWDRRPLTAYEAKWLGLSLLVSDLRLDIADLNATIGILNGDVATLIADMEHMRSHAGADSCADYVLRNRELAARNLKFLAALQEARRLSDESSVNFDRKDPMNVLRYVFKTANAALKVVPATDATATQAPTNRRR